MYTPLVVEWNQNVEQRGCEFQKELLKIMSFTIHLKSHKPLAMKTYSKSSNHGLSSIVITVLNLV